MDDVNTGIDPRQFREVCGQYATGVAVITAKEGARLVGVTVNSFSSVSLDPPLVQFSLDRKASVFPIFSACGYFAVNVLSREQQALSNMFAVRSDAFEEVAFAGGTGGCPVIEGCIANLECEKFAVYDGGDHIIVLGRVKRLQCAPATEPLLFFRGGYRSFS
jgi:flavin reductase (DIM6/NTAB) family NADH-FMN oxidoreductase RutF